MVRLVKVGWLLTTLLSVAIVTGQNQRKADSIRTVLESNNLNIMQEMDALYWLSAYSSSPEEELQYGNDLLKLAEQSNNLEYLIKANQRIGVANRLLGNLGTALTQLFTAADMTIGRDDFEDIRADIYTEISTCYTQNGDSENALRYGLKTIEILRKTDRKQGLAINLLNLGYDYYLIGNYDSAMICYKESEPIFESIDMDIGRAYIIGNRALVYWKQGDKETAKKDLFQAIEMLVAYEDFFGMADYYNQLGNIFFEENDQTNAIQNTMRALEFANKEGLKEQVRDAYYLLYQVYERNRNFEQALQYHSQYHSYKDSIQNLQTTQELANLRTRFEVGQKQAEVDLLLAQKRSDNIIMITGGIILFVVICLALMVYFTYNAKIKLNKQLEEQRNSLISLNTTKDKFFSIISHDLRGPVSNISGLVSVTKYFLDDKSPNKLRDVLAKLEVSVDHLVKLLDNLLHWALQQRGHFPYVPEILGLKDLLLQEVDIASDMAISKNIKIEVSVADELLVYVDRNSTSTIIRNLINNALKFTPNDGHIAIEASAVEATQFASIDFTDNGQGISLDKITTLFSLQENITTKGTSGESGLGLGLLLVNDFVKLNKGSIDVSSEEGKGTTFTVKLPMR